MPQLRCPYCSKKLKTAGGVNHHVSKSPACRRKWQDSLARETFTVDHDEAEPPEDAIPRTPSPVPSNEDDDDPMGVKDDFAYPVHEETPPPEPIPRSRRATIEEVPDDGDPEEEWDLARWLMKNVIQTGTDDYLALPIMSWFSVVLRQLVECHGLSGQTCPECL
ncbi:hypothetical protein B0H14DRAFT_3751766 [Mycena olivaceomarginata]|nr:hypothetical protein B0H14DRAFT_3751766 [Mycena olivaceomarginata]